ncbi:MAG: efflux RND transporter permease subunit [Myxococcota bacterium]|jgi:hypothetical protein|nr:efflux RND transporter permease subunit [Myxococcota bacterium]
MRFYLEFILKYRIRVLIGLSLISLACLIPLKEAVVASSISRMFFAESPDYARYLSHGREYSRDEVIVIALEHVDVFDKKNAKNLRAAIDEIEAIEDVERVLNMLDAQHIFGKENTLHINNYVDEVQGPGELAKTHAAISADPFVGGVLFSHDGEHSVVAVELTLDDSRSAETAPKLLKKVTEIFERHGFERKLQRQTGLVAVMAEIFVQSYYSLETIFPVVAVVLFLVAFLLFRQLWPAILAICVSGVGVLWTMGLSTLVDPYINIMLSIVPAAVLIVGFSDVIHLCSAYLVELEDGSDKQKALIDSATDVGWACYYTSLTTFFGFLSISFVPTPVFRQLGWVLGFGVAISLLLALTLVPIILSFMKTPKAWRVGATGKLQAIIDRFLKSCEFVSVRHPWRVLFGFLLVAVFIGAGLNRFTIETNMVERLDDENHITIDNRFFEENFHESNYFDLLIDTGTPGAVLEPGFMKNLELLQNRIEARSDVGHAYSILDVFMQEHAALKNVGDKSLYPQSREGLAQYLLLFENAGGSDLDRLIDFDRGLVHLSVRLKKEDFRACFHVGNEIAAEAKKIFGPNVHLEPTGIMYLIGGWLDNIVDGQKHGLLFTLISVALMMMIAFRSVRIGLWSMLPNIFPVLFLGALLAFMYDDIDSDTLVLGALAIGIGVDDTIHFLMRYRIEMQHGATSSQAISRAFSYSGRAILMTSLVLGLGFFPYVLSEYYSTYVFGAYLPVVFVAALLADLLLAPALITLGCISYKSKDEHLADSATGPL